MPARARVRRRTGREIVNYESGTVSKVRTRGLEVLQTITARMHAIGIT